VLSDKIVITLNQPNTHLIQLFKFTKYPLYISRLKAHLQDIRCKITTIMV